MEKNPRNIARVVRRYTQEENEIILKEVAKCPLNLKVAFINASKKIDRNPEAISQYYYATLYKSSDSAYVSVSGGVASTGGRKVIARDAKGRVNTEGKVQPLKVLLLSYLKLNVNEQQEFFNVLKALQ